MRNPVKGLKETKSKSVFGIKSAVAMFQKCFNMLVGTVAAFARQKPLEHAW